jgi:hypothetical protein
MITTLKRDCGKFIKEARYNIRDGQFLYRGSETTVANGLMARRTSRLENRRPLGTSQKVHDMLNEAFVKKFGWPVRNGVFTAERDRASGYGIEYIFFPIGNYKYCYSDKVGDLFSVVMNLKYYYDNLERGPGYNSIAQENLEDFYIKMWTYFGTKYRIRPAPDPADIPKAIKVIMDNYTDKNLSVAINDGLEVSFKCKEYYMIEADYGRKITDGLKDEI